MKRICLNCILLICFVPTTAQPILNGGHLGGSFESYTQFYQPDKKINSVLPQDRVGSNNYFKLDYLNGPFSAGLQYESYLPTIAGFPYTLNESKLINRYFNYSPTNFSIQIGDVYEQYGSGLVLRAWENRQIGINNAIEGVKVDASPFPFISLSAVYGNQRKVFAHTKAVVRGLNADFDLTKINPDFVGKYTAGGGLSYVTRYQQYTGADPEFNATVKAISARANLSSSSGSLNLEYVQKGSDPSATNNNDKTTGKAILINGTYTVKNLGINLTLRSMENLDFRGERGETGASVPVNFIPALTKPNDYLTTTIYVYAAQPFAEAGGQIDVFYFLKGRNNRPSRFSLNFSRFGGLKDNDDILSFRGNTYYREANLEWKKTWSTVWNTTITYENLFYNQSVIEGGLHDNVKANIAVISSLYKYAQSKSVRLELQNLFTRQDKGNWLAAVGEFGFAPSYTFFISDLYNYGITNTHYQSIGGSVSKKGGRLALNYGRQRAGLFCVGGICRFVPAATGLTANLSVTF